MKAFEAEFSAGASETGQYPQTLLPEAAFSGRSNVGKSSLLNSIVLRKNLARTSCTPGKTRQINFFNVENRWSFADLPGFGYAAVSKKDRTKWADLIFDYFSNRENLKLVCALVDSRHDPMEIDLGLIEWLENNKKRFLIILTKCDKISANLKAARIKQLEGVIANCSFAVEVLPYSSVSGEGRSELIAIFKKYLVKG